MRRNVTASTIRVGGLRADRRTDPASRVVANMSELRDCLFEAIAPSLPELQVP
jgi:hypothetical protein